MTSLKVSETAAGAATTPTKTATDWARECWHAGNFHDLHFSRYPPSVVADHACLWIRSPYVYDDAILHLVKTNKEIQNALSKHACRIQVLKHANQAGTYLRWFITADVRPADALWVDGGLDDADKKSSGGSKCPDVLQLVPGPCLGHVLPAPEPMNAADTFRIIEQNEMDRPSEGRNRFNWMQDSGTRIADPRGRRFRFNTREYVFSERGRYNWTLVPS